MHALLEGSPFEYRKALGLAERLAAADSPIPTSSKETVTLAANALKHMLITPEEFLTSPFRLRDFSSTPGF
jgi:hypothetical protein